MGAVFRVDVVKDLGRKHKIDRRYIAGQLHQIGRTDDRNGRERALTAKGQSHLAGVQPMSRRNPQIGRRRRKDSR